MRRGFSGARADSSPRAMAATEETADHVRPRRAPRREGAQVARRRASLHALRRPPLLDLRRVQGRGHRDRRRPPRAGGGLGCRGLREGDPQARRCRADRRPRRDERHERDRRRLLQPLADHDPGWPRARDALGLRLASGDRPRPVRRAARQSGGHRQGHGRHRRAHRGGHRPLDGAPLGPHVPRLPARHRLQRGRVRRR